MGNCELRQTCNRRETSRPRGEFGELGEAIALVLPANFYSHRNPAGWRSFGCNAAVGMSMTLLRWLKFHSARCRSNLIPALLPDCRPDWIAGSPRASKRRGWTFTRISFAVNNNNERWRRTRDVATAIVEAARRDTIFCSPFHDSTR